MANNCCILCGQKLEMIVEIFSRFMCLYSKTLFCEWLNLNIILFTKGDYGLFLLCIYLAMLFVLSDIVLENILIGRLFRHDFVYDCLEL